MSELQKSGWVITLFPAMASDAHVSQALAGSLANKDVRIVREYENPAGYVDALQSIDVFLGIRLHSVVAAFCAGTPAIMIGYQPKSLDFMRTIGAEDRFVRVDRLDAGELVARVDEIASKLRHYRDLTTETSQRWKRKTRAYFATVNEAIARA